MKIIKNSEYYVGFDTGLSHYACLENKKSLIILNSGGANKWFPHSKILYQIQPIGFITQLVQDVISQEIIINVIII